MKSPQHAANLINQTPFIKSSGYSEARRGIMSEIDEIIAMAEGPELDPNISYEEWLKVCMPDTMHMHKPDALAPHHRRFWEWAWNLKDIEYPVPYVLILGRGGNKSTTANAFAVYLGALRIRDYIVIIRNTRSGAEETIANIRDLLESPAISEYYPELAQRKLTRYKHSVSYTKTEITTKSGVTFRAISLDEKVRGLLRGGKRPGCFIPDDIDSHDDTERATEKKVQMMTRKILPAGAANCVVFAVQNLIKEDGFFGRIANKTADYLAKRILDGPIPSIADFKWEMRVETDESGEVQKIPTIIAGIATWAGQSLEACQQLIDKYGIASFLKENQHSVKVDPGGMFEPEWFQKRSFIPHHPNTKYIRYWDKGGTRDGGSHTSGVLMALIKHGSGFDNISIYFLDEVRGQWAVTDREAMIIATAHKDRQAYGEGVKVWVEKEPGSGGKESAQATVSRLGNLGFIARADKVVTSKTKRAEPLAAQAAILNVYVLDGPYATGFINRMVSFPNKTDTGDAASGAFRMAARGGASSGTWS
jgi:predicted phage terminase large subunit-like protein